MKFEAAALDVVDGEAVEGAEWTWDFDDGTASASNPATHAYDKPGEYEVTVTADVAGSKATDSVTVNVTQQLDPEFTLELVPPADPVADSWDMKLTGPGTDALMYADVKYTMHRCSGSDEWSQDGGHIIGWDLESTTPELRLWTGMWLSFHCDNLPAETYVRVSWTGWGWPPPSGETDSNVVSATPKNTIIKADPAQGIIKYDPEAEDPTINWNITHREPGPTFDVDVQICDLGGDLLHDVTVEQSGTGPGGYQWDGTCNQIPPPGDQATKGLYTFKLLATHQNIPYCTDRDKSSLLEVGVENFYYFQKDPLAGTLKVVVQYTLNRDAGDAYIKFFDPDLVEIGSLTGQDTTKGTHWSDVYELSGVEFDENEAPVEPLYCVLYAEEIGADAVAYNRDHVPKPALQAGTSNLEYTPVGLKQVAFRDAEGHDNCHTVRADDDQHDYSGPHWLDRSDPLDGDADDGIEFQSGADKKFPVCYTWELPMNASCTIHAQPDWGPFQQGSVFVRGTGPGGMGFPAQEATVAGTTAIYPATDSDEALAKAVKRYAGLDIAWEISTDSGSTWHYAGSSENEVFVYRPDGGDGEEPPGCDTTFRTVLYVACNGGGSTEEEIINSTWSEFTDLDVRAWAPDSKGYDRIMKYWDTVNASQSMPQMLQTQDGTCAAWMELLLEAFETNYMHDQGMHTVVDTEVLPPNGDDPPHGFVVPNVGGPNPPQPQHPLEPDGYVWDISQFDLSVPGVAGQGNETPAAKAFENHYIVHRRFGSYPSYDHNWHDPSYGEMWGGETDFTMNAVVYWTKLLPTSPPTYGWKPDTDDDGLEVEFHDALWGGP